MLYWRVMGSGARHGAPELVGATFEDGELGQAQTVMEGLETVPLDINTLDVAPDGRWVFVRFVEHTSEIWLLKR